MPGLDDMIFLYALRGFMLVAAVYVAFFCFGRSFVHRSRSHTVGNRTIAACAGAIAYTQVSLLVQQPELTDRTIAVLAALVACVVYVVTTFRETDEDIAHEPPPPRTQTRARRPRRRRRR